jgi:hypothetical protein
MCFSAPASFLASVVLCTAGVATCRLARNQRQLLLAAIPLLFGIQQAAEGFVWLSFSYSAFESLRMLASYVFLFFAFVVWPIWAPVAVYFYEPVEPVTVRGLLWQHVVKRVWPHAQTPEMWITRVSLQKLMIGAGLLVSGYLAMGLMAYDLVTQIVGCHILYAFPFANPQVIISSVLYVAATIGSCMLSSSIRVRYLGAILSISYLVTALFYKYAFVSVWCFFAAILSAGIWWIMREQN